MKPAATPSARALLIAAHRGHPAFQVKPRTALASPRLDATERSTSPEIMMSIMGRAIMAFSMKSLTIKERLEPIKKYGEREAPMMIAAIRSTTSSASHELTHFMRTFIDASFSIEHAEAAA
jgi:hypothetical protein